MTKVKAHIIGGGFAGLAAASCLANDGYDVTVFEKNAMLGGRARKFEANGFVFDMGPSWYWMPDVFESFFNKFGKSAKDYYNLKRLDPSYSVFFGKDDVMEVPANLDELHQIFESLEPGSSAKLTQFLKEAAYKYEVGINDLVYKPGRSLREFVDMRLITGVFRLQVFNSIYSHIRKYFKHPKLIQLLEFPVLFLGATPRNTPALYSLMNYADIELGTWYPMGGMHKIVEGMVSLAESLGVKFETNANVEQIKVKNGTATGLIIGGEELPADVIIGGADYHHVEQHLLEEKYRKYSEHYWDKREMAPSSLIFYLGIDKKLKNLHHHNLFFDQAFEQHAIEIYEQPQWPSEPLFYVCCPSVTDASVAPEGKENMFILVPVAPDLKDDEATREKYYNLVMERLEKLTGQSVKEHVIYKKSYAHNDFINDYNSFKGNAYGLANTLRQTAILKPSLKSSKVSNLYYTGQLTVPGPGVPPSLISGQVVAQEIAKAFKNKKEIQTI
ncbi:phytoene desaturase family protein [Microscilla marina]|uniref:Phytoene desaturase n=1 Tax=Microscilla marina ATCC 23134 TaxID=313606 RepID=A1ZX51_MICM2|nr:phytoene desaturase family protein [Microscilla marina]EAY25032.1 phytoene desaturase [Microscilla marina ATCC 23134]